MDKLAMLLLVLMQYEQGVSDDMAIPSCHRPSALDKEARARIQSATAQATTRKPAMTLQTRKAFKLPELPQFFDWHKQPLTGWYGQVYTEQQMKEYAIAAIEETLAVDKESLTTEAQQSNKQGCEHCNHPLYCGTKCKNCGKQSDEQVEPDLGGVDVFFPLGITRPTAEEVTRTHPPVPTAQPEQEPVAWIEHHKGGDNLNWEEVNHPYAKATPLYTHPPVPTAQPDRK